MMADVDREPHPMQFLDTLRQHVLRPIITAERIVSRERTEVTAERDAFASFADRVTSLDPVPWRQEERLQRVLVNADPPNEKLERVRTAYRETVMSVDHYDTVYGEPMSEHVAAECGPDLAAGICAERTAAFTPAYKTAIQTAAA